MGCVWKPLTQICRTLKNYVVLILEVRNLHFAWVGFLQLVCTHTQHCGGKSIKKREAIFSRAITYLSSDIFCPLSAFKMSLIWVEEQHLLLHVLQKHCMCFYTGFVYVHCGCIKDFVVVVYEVWVDKKDKCSGLLQKTTLGLKQEKHG